MIKGLSILLLIVAVLLIGGGIAGFFLNWTPMRCILSLIVGFILAGVSWSSLKKYRGFLT